LRQFHRLGVTLILWLAASFVHAERIKDMAQVQGVRTNQLVGYGLVVGLNGTGDQTSQAPFTIQSLMNMLAQLGVEEKRIYYDKFTTTGDPGQQ